MNWYVYIPFAILIVLASYLALIKSMHMFQLNSYKPATHLKWIYKNAAKFWTQGIFLLLLTVYFFTDHIAVQIALILLCGLFCFFNKPVKNAKKPLVYTSRVKRMLLTFTLLIVCIIVATAFLPLSRNLIILGLLYVFSPIAPIVSNIINAPIEAAIRRYYIKDAKKILKSCPRLLIIGITGSYGKTSMKYYLTALLNAKYNVLMTPESFNTPMGVVKTIRESLRSTHEIFVCEMGARHRGDIKELCDIVSPRHGMITSIGEQHLETMKTIETIIETKFELAKSVNGRGIVFLNGDNPYIKSNLPEQDFQTYGLSDTNDFYARDIKVTSSGTTFSLNCHGTIIPDFQTRLIGEHNVSNLVGAMAMCSYLGVSYDDMKIRLKKITSPPHRLQLSKKNDILMIDDSYNSNPNGCEAALKTLSLFDGYKILITPGMVELGVKQYDANYEFGRQAAAVCDFVILVGEKQTKPIYQGLLHAKFDKAKIFITDKFGEAIGKAYGIVSDRQKVILLENDLPDNY